MQFGAGLGLAGLTRDRSNHWVDQVQSAIQRHRTARIELEITDPSDRPVAGQRMRLEHIGHLFQFGCAYFQHLAVRDQETTYDQRLRQYFLQLCNAATVTFYWADYEPQRGQYRDQPLLEKIAWLKSHNFYVRGHPLFWNHNPACFPSWLDPQISDRQLLALLQALLNHLSAEIFPKINEVDVFNELTFWEIYDHPLTRLLKGEHKLTIVRDLFVQFKALNPQVRSAINDFVPTFAYFQLVRSLINLGTPIEAIGQQSHMHRGYWSNARLVGILDRFRTLSLPVTFTEVSVLSADPRPNLDFSRTYTDWHSTPQGEQKQAEYLKHFYQLLYSQPQVRGIYLWGMSDRHAWLGAPTGILDQNGAPKPAYLALNQLINHDWRTSGDYHTDALGRLAIPNAYEGHYQLVVNGQNYPLGKHTARQPLRQKVKLVNPI
jgi:endo-1,4-beta-xylanase